MVTVPVVGIMADGDFQDVCCVTCMFFSTDLQAFCTSSISGSLLESVGETLFGSRKPDNPKGAYSG